MMKCKDCRFADFSPTVLMFHSVRTGGVQHGECEKNAVINPQDADWPIIGAESGCDSGKPKP